MSTGKYKNSQLCLEYASKLLFSLFSCFYCSFMNITMRNVVFVNQRGKMYPLDNFFVLARNVKYIHIPKEVRCEQFYFILLVRSKFQKYIFELFERLKCFCEKKVDIYSCSFWNKTLNKSQFQLSDIFTQSQLSWKASISLIFL